MSAPVLENQQLLSVTDIRNVAPNSRRIVAGANISIDLTTPGQEIISATGGGGGSTVVTGPDTVAVVSGPNTVVNRKPYTGHVQTTDAGTGTILNITAAQLAAYGIAGTVDWMITLFALMTGGFSPAGLPLVAQLSLAGGVNTLNAQSQAGGPGPFLTVDDDGAGGVNITGTNGGATGTFDWYCSMTSVGPTPP